MTPRSALPDILRAAEFAARAHAKQERKYTGEPYIVHPLSVARVIAEDGGTVPQILTAILHDVIEDTRVKPSELQSEFGSDVLVRVLQVSKPFRVGPPPPRAQRVAEDNAHFAGADPEQQSVKLADCIDNLRTLVQRDRGFATIQMAEKRDLLAVMTRGSPRLYSQARRLVDEFFAMEARR